MTRGPIIHGVLLVVVLIFAYQTWTKEEKVERDVGDIQVWSVPADSITAITYDSENRTIKLEQRSEGGQSYYWGQDIRVVKKSVGKKPAKKDDSAEPAEPPQPETETKIRDFAIGKKGQEAVENLADLRALRDLGALDDDRRKEYELDDSKDNITVSYNGKSRSLVVGGRVPGSGGGRYVLEMDSGKAYALAATTLRDLLAGESGMRLRKAHIYDDEDVGKAVVTAAGKTRNLVRITVENEKGTKSKNWADASDSSKPDQTMSNFLQNVAKLSPSQYAPKLDAKSLKLVVKVEYQRENGEKLGWLELYEQPPEPEESPAAPPAAPTEPATPTKGEKGEDTAGKSEPAGQDKTGQQAAPADKNQPAKAAPGQKPAPAEKKEKPTPPKMSHYYIRTEATRTYAKVLQSTATRIAEDIDQIFTE
ncbi:MAG: DUF4340 domain-containing protein [Proteobacteria bacterium]|nr:DUF4340 domain-containing protein [Pseudomonadota bacterium]